MKIYQHLEFRGDPQALDLLPSQIEKRLTDGWSRNHERESEWHKVIFDRTYCFSCTAAGTRPASSLGLAERSPGVLYVSNIVPADTISLTYDDYNRVLEEFYSRFARPAADLLGVTVVLGRSEVCIEDLLSKSAVQLLRRFSSTANRSYLLPLDRKRWNEFLTAVHREGTSLDTSMLRRWLIEEEKWAADQAEHLVSEYENAQQLLKVYESQQV